jgi:hypothetical protein
MALPGLAQEAGSNARPLSAMIADLEAQGYRITDVDVDPDAIEVDAVAADGRPMDLRLDPATGAVRSETLDD